MFQNIYSHENIYFTPLSTTSGTTVSQTNMVLCSQDSQSSGEDTWCSNNHSIECETYKWKQAPQREVASCFKSQQQSTLINLWGERKLPWEGDPRDE